MEELTEDKFMKARAKGSNLYSSLINYGSITLYAECIYQGRWRRWRDSRGVCHDYDSVLHFLGAGLGFNSGGDKRGVFAFLDILDTLAKRDYLASAEARQLLTLLQDEGLDVEGILATGEAPPDHEEKKEEQLSLLEQRSADTAQNALDLFGTFAKPGRPPADTEGNDDNVIIPMRPTGLGNSADYLARRLKKAGREDLLEQIGPGRRFRSIRAAAIEADIVKDVPTVRLTTPEKAAATIRKHWDAEQIRTLCNELLAWRPPID